MTRAADDAPREVERVRAARRPSASAPNSQDSRPLRRWSRSCPEPVDVALDAVDQVAGGTSPAPDDLSHDAGDPGEHVLEHRHELADRVDDRLIAPTTLSTRPRFSAWSSLDPPRRAPCEPSTVLRRKGVPTRIPALGDLARAARTGRRSPSTPRSRPSGGPWAGSSRYVDIAVLPDAIRFLAAVRSPPTMSATRLDGDVHLLEVELAPGHVELVDLVRHPADLVPEPAGTCRPTAVPVFLYADILPRRVPGTSSRAAFSPIELLLHLGSMPSRIFHVGSGGVEDRLDASS